MDIIPITPIDQLDAESIDDMFSTESEIDQLAQTLSPQVALLILKEFRGAGWADVELSLTQQGLGQNTNDSDGNEAMLADHRSAETTASGDNSDSISTSMNQIQPRQLQITDRLDIRI